MTQLRTYSALISFAYLVVLAAVIVVFASKGALSTAMTTGVATASLVSAFVLHFLLKRSQTAGEQKP
jgi:hypothetical protein